MGMHLHYVHILFMLLFPFITWRKFFWKLLTFISMFNLVIYDFVELLSHCDFILSPPWFTCNISKNSLKHMLPTVRVYYRYKVYIINGFWETHGTSTTIKILNIFITCIISLELFTHSSSDTSLIWFLSH